jgi:putative tryptophan/tyrosine transport system substrate-binding protein
MRRRQFLSLLGGAATAWPLTARAQQPAMPVIGYLNVGVPRTNEGLEAFRKGLSDAGYVEGRNVAIEYRWAQNDVKRLPELAADLVRRRVNVIATLTNTTAALAAKAATTTIPIVFGAGGDPVESGLVASLNRPGGNVTGIITMNVEIGAKRLGLLHELVPAAVRIALLVNPNNPTTEPTIKNLHAAASSIGRQVEVLPAGTNADIDTAFARLVPMRADALMVGPDVLFTNRSVQIATLAVRHALPAIYPFRSIVEAGGLMSYAASGTELNRQAGIYTGRVLKGEKPADLPIVRATKFEFVINLQTAKTLAITIPATLLAQADEVIE